MVEEKTFLLAWMSKLLDWLGINTTEGGYKSLFATIVVLLCCLIVWRLLRFILLRALHLSKHVGSNLEIVFDTANVKKIALMVAVIIFYMMLPLAFDPSRQWA